MGAEQQRGTQYAVDIVVVLDTAVVRAAEAGADPDLEVIADQVVEVDAEAVAVEARADDRTVLVEVGTRYVELGPIGTPGEVHVRLRNRCRAEDLVEPVGGRVGSGVVVEVAQAQGTGLNGSAVALAHHLLYEADVFRAGQGLEAAPYFLVAVVAVDADLRFLLLAALGRDEHDAVAGAGAVDGCRCGVFQDFDGLDVRWVQVGQGVDLLAAHANLRVAARIDGDTVHYVQRLVAGRNRRGAAHADGYRRAGRTRGGRDLYAGGLALQRLVHTGDRQTGDLLGGNLGYRARQFFAALGAVADYHDVFQRDRLGFQRDGVGRGRAEGHFFRGIARVADHQGGRVGRGLQLEAAVNVGNGPGTRPFYQDRGADERLGFFVHDLTCDRPLGHQRHRAEQQERQD